MYEMSSVAETRIFTDPADVAQAAADAVIKDLAAAIAAYGNAIWVIAGGTLPVAAYRILAATAGDKLDWSQVTIVIGDERCVPFDSPDANWTQADEAFLKHVQLAPITKRPATNLDAEGAAADYETYLQQLPQTQAGLPRFDHVWLGVGEDGHTLSLFPNHPSSLEVSGKLVIAVHDSPKPPADRISLTFKALQGASNCMIMAAGAGKAVAIARALDGDESLPVAQAAAVIERAGGQVTWLLDQAAAGQVADNSQSS